MRALAAASLVFIGGACSSAQSVSTATPDSGGSSSSGQPVGITPCEALASCCNAGGITGSDEQSCSGPFDAGANGQSFCQGNFDSLRRDGFCADFAYNGFIPYTLGMTPSKVTSEPSACAAISACCVSNEVWGDEQQSCEGFADGTTDQTACAGTFNSLRGDGYCGGFTFTGAAPLGSGGA